MTLWERTLRIIGVVIFVLGGLLYTLQRFVVLRSFSELEARDTRLNVERVLNIIAHETQSLDVLVNDWAAWDDTYQFVADGNEQYRRSNLLDQTFITARLNLILIVDSAARVVFARAFDLANGTAISIPELAPERLYLGHPLLTHPDTASSISGVMMLSSGPMLVASRPIITSADQGPIRGTLVMGRFLDQAMIQYLSDIAQLSVQVQPIDSPELPADFRAAQSLLTAETPLWVQPLNRASVAGYALLNDLAGKPALILRIDLPRDIYRQGQASFRYLTAALILGGLLFFVVLLLSLESTVLWRIDDLGEQIKQVGQAGDLSARVSLVGRDEVAELAGKINAMLSDLQQAQESVHQRERYLEGLAKAAEALLVPAADIPYQPFLEALGQASQASRVYLLLNPRRSGQGLPLSQVAEWRAPGLAAQVNNAAAPNLPGAVGGFQRWMDVLSRGEPIHGLVSELPPEERAVLEPQGIQAILVLPLILDRAFSGLIGFEQCDRARRWEASEVNFLRLAAADLTKTLKRKRDEKVQSAIYRVSETAHAVKDLPELFRSIHEIIGELMPAQNFYIALYDPATETLSFPYFVDEYDAPPAPKKPGRGLTEYVLRTGEPVLVSPEVFAELEQKGEVESIGVPSIDWLGVPLKAEDKPIGVLVVQSYTEGVRYGEEEKDILQYVSHQVAMAIEHKRADEALRESENKYRTIFETTGTATVIVEEDTTISLANKEFARLCGYSRAEVEGKKSWTEFVVPDDLERMKEYHRLRRVDAEAAPTNYEFRFVDRQGQVRDCFLTVDMIPGTRKSVASVLDITARKQMEEELLQLKDFNEGIVRGVAEALIIEDAMRIITFVNPALEKLLGYRAEELVGCHWQKIVPAREIKRVQAETAQRPAGISNQYETWLLSKDGREIAVMVSATPLFEQGAFVGVLSAFTDITQRKQAEEERQKLEAQLRQAQKMEAIGLLAGGVAHEFNNLLTVIQGNAELGLPQVEPSQPLSKGLSAILRAARRGATLTQQLLAFSRHQELQPRVLDLNKLIATFSAMLGPLIGVDIDLQVKLAPEVEPVYADAAALEQVLMNLSLNARDAMPQGGALHIETAAMTLDAAYCRIHPEARVGNYIRMTVADTGIGMDKATQEHLFEPFFTTKEVGKGTGLGLSMAYGIVKQHHGLIEVSSQPGQGTRFDIYLPVYQAAVEEGAAESELGARVLSES